jgi:hypothetical protein
MKVGATRLLVTLAAAGALALAGCGGGGGDDHSGSTAGSAATTTTTTTAQSSQAPSGDGNGTESASGTSKKLALGSPADVPRSEGGDNSIQDYGSEASEADRAAAGRALQAYYDALVSGDTEGACALLTSRIRDGVEKTLEQLGGQGGSKAPTTCAQILKLTVRTGPRSPQLQLTELLSLRRQGDDAFLIYRAGDGKVYAIAMSEENGDWRVGGVSAAPLAA